MESNAKTGKHEVNDSPGATQHGKKNESCKYVRTDPAVWVLCGLTPLSGFRKMTMNMQFQTWFSQGKIAEALSGIGEHFIADITYREDHAFGLAVGQLLQWAKQGHQIDAARGFENALILLLQAESLKSALRLMRSYGLLVDETGTALPLNNERVMGLIALSAREAGAELARDEGLRSLLILVTQQFPSLKEKIGLS